MSEIEEGARDESTFDQSGESSDLLKEISAGAFWGCSSLKKVKIRSSITRIDEYTFHKCTSLREVILPSTVQAIGREAFSGCSKLVKVNLPEGLQSIDPSAFKGCMNLPIDNIELPSSIKEKMKKDPKYDPFEFIREQDPWLPETIEKQRNNLFIKEGPGADPDFGGKTQRGYGPEWWAISRKQIEDFKKHPGYNMLTMREFVKKVIERITDGLGIGYALFVNQGEPLRAVIMISHAWDELLREFVENILRSGEEGPFWIDSFAIYQNMDESMGVTISQQLGPVPERSPFAIVLKNVYLMLLIITSECDIYSRLWCVYELFIASKNGVDVKLCPFIDENDLKMGRLHKDECIAKAAVSVNSEAARCGNPSNPVRNADELAIRDTIEQSDGKFRSVDEAVEFFRFLYRSVDVAVEFFRFLYLIDYPTEKIEERVTSARDNIKVAIELILSRLPFREQTMKYDAFVQHQLSENQGCHIMERPDDVDSAENSARNYHYIVSNSPDIEIETFAA